MTLSYDLFWSFRSPYSYLLTPRLVALERDFDVRAVVRPVYPLAIRTPEFFGAQDPLWIPYLLRDIQREAEFLDLPIRWPRPDPVRMDPASRRYPAEQPHIHRLTRAGVAAAELGRGLAYLEEVSRVIWSGEVDDWHAGDHLGRAAERAGLDPLRLDARVDGEAGRLHQAVEANQAAQREAGHWGVPLMVFEGEPFFGQDRFEQLRWRLGRRGLRSR